MSRDDLVTMIQMMTGTCQGVYDHAQRTPTWNIRISFYRMCWEFLESGSERDMYIFCRDYISILRLSIIEYFIYFLHTYMSVEESILD